ncbi:Sphingoid long-chain base transporter RSB1-like protein 6 [Seiridium cupressi]
MAPFHDQFDIRELKHPEETKTPYGYVPHFGINVTFLVAYCILGFTSVISILHCLPSKHRRWLLRSLLVATAIFIELVGFVERVRGAGNPKSYEDFLVQLALLNSAPAFITAAISVSMYQLIKAIGHQHRFKISPKHCYAFGVLDLAAAALVIFGSLTALHWGSEETSSRPEGPEDPVAKLQRSTATFLKLIQAAMVVQILSISIFLGLLIAATWHRANNAIRIPKDFVFCMVGASVLVAIRAIAKIAEGGIAPNEWLYFGVDSVLMVIATAIMTAGHPLLSWTEQRLRITTQDEEILTTAEEEEQQEQASAEARQTISSTILLGSRSVRGEVVAWGTDKKRELSSRNGSSEAAER